MGDGDENASAGSGNTGDKIDNDRQDLNFQIGTIKRQVQELRNIVEYLKKENNVDKIVYNLMNLHENYFKLFNYFIKSISSIYIYILLGDEYEDLYKKIENLLDVNPFEQIKNHVKFKEVIGQYPIVTHKTKIEHIFLYHNQEIKNVIQLSIPFHLMVEFNQFLQKNNCNLLDFYVYIDTDYHVGLDLKRIYDSIYLDRFKDEELVIDYEHTRSNFQDFLAYEFPYFRYPLNIFVKPPENTFNKMSKKRYRNYLYILYNKLSNFGIDIREEIKNPCS